MRLDKYLKVARIIKRRTVANDACDASHVSVNGKPAKASYDVKLGDIIEVSFGSRVMRVRVTDVKDSTKKAAEAAVTAVFEAIAKALENNEEVQVFGFGKFAVNERAAREGRTPATGEKITIAASKYPAFSASKALKDRVNG